MTPLDWTDCVTALGTEWPSGKQKFGLERWRRRFAHLPRDVFLATVERYADEHTSPPTVNALAAYLPRGYSTEKGTNGHLHLWDELGPVEAGTATLCNTCGTHAPWCTCNNCTCQHVMHHDGEMNDGRHWVRCRHCDRTRLAPKGVQV